MRILITPDTGSVFALRIYMARGRLSRSNSVNFLQDLSNFQIFSSIFKCPLIDSEAIRFSSLVPYPKLQGALFVTPRSLITLSQMRILTLVLLIFAITALNTPLTPRCKCSQLMSQTDCTTLGCTWSNNSCSDGTCANLKSESACDASVLDCVWKNSACEKFTKCADYTAPAGNTCVYWSKQPQYCAGSSTAACQNALATCAEYTTQVNCSIGSTDGMCVWANNACVKFTACTQILNMQQCMGYQCTWKNNACAAKTCADSTTQSECTHFMKTTAMTLDICKWDGAKCTDATDVAHLTSDTCQKITEQVYTWNGNSCVKCGANSSFGSYTLASILFVVSLLM